MTDLAEPQRLRNSGLKPRKLGLLQRLMQHAKNLFKIPLLMQCIFSMSAFIYPSYTFLANKVDFTSGMVLIGFVSVHALELFLLAKCSDEANYQNLLVSDAIYESDWLEKTVDSRKKLRLMIQAAQKYRKLTAYDLYTFDLEGYMQIVRTSFSIVTLLLQISHQSSFI